MPEKEIWKLLELLNEYDGDVLEYWFVDGCIRRRVKNFNDERNSWRSVIWYTKEFWFIKRLVEHHKLLHPDFIQHLKLFYWDSMPEENFYIMMLAIAPNPIEELCKMLRP